MKTNMRLIFAAIHFATHKTRAHKNSPAVKNKQLLVNDRTSFYYNSKTITL